MHIRILGSAAGGGYPQWNCNCRNCLGLRKRRIRSVARTQSSIAVSANAGQWVLFNCSPDVRAQFEAFPPMQPARSVRDTGMSAIVLIDSQIDHTTGLLTLREGEALEIYCTGRVHHDLVTRFPVLQVLEHYCGVHWHEIPIDGNGGFVVPGQESLRFTAVALSSKAPPYSEDRNNPQPGDTIGVQVRDFATGSNLFYAPGLGVIEPQVRRRLEEADCRAGGRHLLAGRRATTRRHQRPDRRADGTPAAVGPRGHDGSALRARGKPEDTYPHQQHQSHTR